MSDKESSSSNNSFEFKSNDNNNDDLNNILVTTPKVLHPTLSSISSDHHLNLLLQVTNSLYKSSLPLSCSHSPLITMNPCSEENITISSMISSDNIFINKFINIFAILIDKIDEELDEDAIYKFVLYGEDMNETIDEGEAEENIATFIKEISSMYERIKILISLSINLINQLISVYNGNAKYYKDSFKNILLISPIKSLSKIFGYFNIIDLIVEQNENLNQHWKLYRLMISKCKSMYQNDNDFLKLEKRINKFNNSIMSGSLNIKCIKNIMDSTGLIVTDFIKSNSIKEYQNYLYTSSLKIIDECINEIDSMTETYESDNLFNMISMMPYLKEVLNDSQYSDIYLHVYKCQNKINFISLYSNGIDLNIYEFISQYKPSSVIKLIPSKKISNVIEDNQREMISKFHSTTQMLREQTLTCITKLNSDIFQSNKGTDDDLLFITKQIKTIINAMILSFKLKHTICNVLTFFAQNDDENYDINNYIIDILQCLESLKSIQITIEDVHCDIVKNTMIYQRYIKTNIEILIDDIDKSMGDTLNAYQSDIAAAINIIKDNLKGESSKKRMNVIALSLDLISEYIKNRNEDSYEEIFFLLWKLNLLLSPDKTIRSICNCDFLYWYRDLFPSMLSVYASHINEHPLIRLFMLSISDTSNLLSYVRHKNYTDIIKQYQNVIMQTVEKSFLKPIAVTIENDLRLTIAHSEIDSAITNTHEVSSSYNVLLNQEINIFPGLFINVKHYVQNYLERIFYNINAISNDDLIVYYKMKNFAKLKYNIIIDNRLLISPPRKNEDSSFDIVEIVKDFNRFAMNHHYDFHSEKYTTKVNKEDSYVNVISIEDFISSIKQKDIGIVNSIINVVFSYIATKIKELVCIVMDDFIKSLLLREKYNWTINPHSSFDIKTAREFNEKNTKITDKLTDIIIYIGNSIAFIRSISTALSSLIVDNTKISSSSISFQPLPSNTQYTNTTSIFSSVLNTNYLLSVLNTLDTSLVKYHSDLSLLSYIVPSLTLRYLDRITFANETLSKHKINDDIYYRSDGFAVGLAFISKLLHIESIIDSLKWFDKEDIEEKMKMNFNIVYIVYDCAMLLFNK